VVTPLAVIVVLLPEQIVADVGESDIVGAAVTVTVTEPVFTHPAAEVPVMVYVVVTVGVATTAAPVVVFNPVAGDHV